MRSSIIPLAAAVLTVAATFAVPAQAGGCGGGYGGGMRVYQSRPMASYNAQLRAKKAQEARAIAAAKRKRQIELAQARSVKKEKPAVSVAAAAETAEVHQVATEESSASASPATSAPLTVAEAKTTCSKFIAATGTTAEVACPKE